MESSGFHFRTELCFELERVANFLDGEEPVFSAYKVERIIPFQLLLLWCSVQFRLQADSSNSAHSRCNCPVLTGITAGQLADQA